MEKGYRFKNVFGGKNGCLTGEISIMPRSSAGGSLVKKSGWTLAAKIIIWGSIVCKEEVFRINWTVEHISSRPYVEEDQSVYLGAIWNNQDVDGNIPANSPKVANVLSLKT